MLAAAFLSSAGFSPSLRTAAPLTAAQPRYASLVMSQPPRPQLELPAKLLELGCDAELWSEIKGKKGLIKLTLTADDATLAARIEKLRQVIADGPILTPKDKKWGPPLARSEQRKEGPYELYGEVPEGFDSAKASALVDERAACKLSKDYARADEVREECLKMGVKIRDDYRTWYVVRKA